jgi:hypothetical protein
MSGFVVKSTRLVDFRGYGVFPGHLGIREFRETTGMGESSPKVLDRERRALSK